MNTDPNPTPVTVADTPYDHVPRDEQRRRARAAAKGQPPESSPGPNRAERRGHVAEAKRRHRRFVRSDGQ